MKRYSIFLIFTLLFLLFTGCDKIIDHSSRWSKTFGGSNDDWGNSVTKTDDNFYVLVGKTYSYGSGNGDLWVIKTDSVGTKLFSKTYGGNNGDWGNWIEKTQDGGFIIVGVTSSYGQGSYDFYLIKIDADGNKQFSKTFGDAEEDLGYCVKQTHDGGFIIVGGTKSFGAGNFDVYLIKTDANGEKIWSNTFGGDKEDWGYSVCETSDGGYIIAGITSSYGSGLGDVWLIKTDSLGNKKWDRTFGDSQDDGGVDVKVTGDNGFIIAGVHGSGYGDLWMIKTDSLGNKKWDKKFGGSNQDGGTSVDIIEDGYIVVGSTFSYGSGNGDLWIIKIDSNGNKIWDRTFGGSEQDGGISVRKTNDGGFIITGMTKSYGEGNSDVWLIKTDSNGETD